MDFRRAVAAFVLAAFTLAGGFGVLHVDMDMDASGGMSACPFMGMTALCQMTPFEHIEAWQSMFAAILPAQSVILALVLLVAAFIVPGLGHRLWLLHPSPQFVLIAYDSERVAHDPLQRFIARGLLHPKIF